MQDRIKIVSDGVTLLAPHTSVTRADGQEIMDIRKVTVVMELNEATVAILEHVVPQLELSAQAADVFVDATGRRFVELPDNFDDRLLRLDRNGERLAACLRACKDIPTEALHAGVSVKVNDEE